MPPRMRTQSAGRPAAESLERGTGVRVGRGGRGRRPREACNPKEYNGKGGDVVLTRWIEKIENVHEMQNLESELWNHAMVGAGHAAYADRFYELARLVKHLVTPKSKMIEMFVYGLAP
nr:reverse transcriptase domain-containing protein [Tanacetum cinerariifolium]